MANELVGFYKVQKVNLGFPRYAAHSSGTPFLDLSIFIADNVSGIAIMSKSLGACNYLYKLNNKRPIILLITGK